MPRLEFFKRKKFWVLFTLIILILPFILVGSAVGIVFYQQDAIVQQLVETLNKDFKGELDLEDSHIDLFENFPYISIDLEEVKIYETKGDHSSVIVDVHELFLGFNLLTILSGDMSINDIHLKDGEIDLVQHLDGRFNVEVALSSDVEAESTSEEFHLDLKEIELENIDLNKYNEENDVVIDALIARADAKFTTKPEHTYVYFDAQFEMNVIKEGDTTFIKHKHFDLHTQLDYLTEEQTLSFQPTTINLENSAFDLEGKIDLKNDMYLDLLFSGNKKNFDLLIAMAPEELVPTLQRYENGGGIFFETTVKGKSIHGASPAIEATFICENAFLKNIDKNKTIDELNFKGSFTSEKATDPSTMKFHLQDFSAHPEVGEIKVDLEVINFNDPEIDLQLNSSFELGFLIDFFNLTEISDVSGAIDLQMNFHDIINIDAPEHTLAQLNEAYYAKLEVEDLKFKYGSGNTVLKDLDLFAEMNGNKAEIQYCDLKLGNSDLSLKGEISDLPAIIHHTDVEVDTRLSIKSKLIDIYELTGADSNAVNEQIKNLALDLDFKSSAKALTESPNLPVGEFFIENLYAELQHYPHALHDFHADIFIDNENLKIVDLKGEIDQSDFLFSGNLKHYDLWLSDVKNGDTEVDFDFVSNQLRLEDLLAYQGENYVPEEYRHEELKGFKFHGNVQLHYKDTLHSIDLQLDHFNAKMKLHPLAFQKFNGRAHYEEEHLVVEDFSGKLGRSDFKTTLHYYLGQDESIKKRDNHFSFASRYLDIDEVINYNNSPNQKVQKVQEANHDSVFNIYELPFTDMTFDVEINDLNYHQYKVDEIHAKMRTTPNHYLYIDKLSLLAAGGKVTTTGYFNGSNPNLIYFSPDLYLDKIDLDQLFVKFDNFGQDHLVSENLHGELTGHLTGKIHMHTDLVPKIDDSEIHMDVHVENGKLENVALLEDFSDYFKDKNLKKVLFDTLENHIDMKNGVMNIPSMTINSSLGFMEISGSQDADFNYEYFMRVPWKLVSQTVASKLFKRKKKDIDPDQEDAIEYGSEKTKYVNIKIKGNEEDYSVSLGKDKRKKRKK